mgnify:CR=1 FL=1
MKYLVLFFALVVTTTVGFSQSSDTTKLMRIEKNDGTIYVGTILSDDGREVLINTQSLGKIYIPKADIRSIEEVSPDDVNEEGIYEPEGPFTTRYYFTTNALPLKKGDDYVMLHLYGPEVHFAVGNDFSVGVMTSWWASPFIVALKKSFRTKNEKVNLSLATLIGSSGYLNTFRGYGGLGFGTFTYGSPANNFSFSAGYGFIDPGFNNLFTSQIISADDGFYPDDQYTYDDLVTSGPSSSRVYHSPLFQIAGMKKLGKKVSFFFDSMFSISNAKETNITYENGGAPQNTGWRVSTTKELQTLFFLMPGVRFQKSPRNAFQVALAGATYIRGSNTIAFPVPQCSWFFKF